jgi:hypothetical protein
MQRRPSPKRVTLRCGVALGPDGAGCVCTVGVGTGVANTRGVAQLAIAIARLLAMNLVTIMMGLFGDVGLTVSLP